MSEPCIGVLAVQGAFAEHIQRLHELGFRTRELRQPAHLDGALGGLVLPGGESTTQAKLLRDLNMLDPLRALVKEGVPILGTCAGLILLSQEVENGPAFERLSTMPVTVRRNGYGRQLGSFEASAPLLGGEPLPLTFIRAPRITHVGDGVEVIVALNDEPVAVRYQNQLGCCFHPELTPDARIYHLLFS